MDRKPLDKGTLIAYCEEVAEVVEDYGDDRLLVKIDDTIQRWYWEFEGVKCRVIEQPDKLKNNE